MKSVFNKKVLLRERKRHTDRRVASTRYVASVGGGGVPPSRSRWGGGHPPSRSRWGGVPPSRSRWGGGAPPHPGPGGGRGAGQGTPPIQVQVEGGGVGWGTPPHPGPGGGQGRAPPQSRSRWGGWGAPRVPPPPMWTDKQTENITSSRTTYAVGNNCSFKKFNKNMCLSLVQCASNCRYLGLKFCDLKALCSGIPGLHLMPSVLINICYTETNALLSVMQFQ